jgi:hypothetical protein
VLWGSVLCTLHLAYLLIFSFDCRYSFGCGTESVRALTVAPQSGCEITNRGCNIMPPEKNYFSTRKIIVDEIARRAQIQSLTEDIVAKQMDEERGSISLDKLFKAIREDKKRLVD